MIGSPRTLAVRADVANQSNPQAVEILRVSSRQVHQVVRPIHLAPADVMTIGRAVTSEISKILCAFQQKPANGHDARGSRCWLQMKINPAGTPRDRNLGGRLSNRQQG